MTALDLHRDAARDLNDALPEHLEMTGTDLPVPPAESADDNYRLPVGARRSYVDAALSKLAEAETVDAPVRARRRWLEHLDARAEEAERNAESSQRALVATVEAMRRRDVGREGYAAAYPEIAIGRRSEPTPMTRGGSAARP